MAVTDLRGIDISSWQKGMDAASIKTVDFAILKISEGQSWDDPCFDEFYDAARSTGVPVGAYVYSHAVTEAAARAEAEHAIKLLRGREIPLGLYIDVEDGPQLSLHDSVLTAVVKAFCDEVKASGIIAGAYGSGGQLWAKVGPSYIGNDVIVWVASWGLQPRISCDIWQYASTITVKGYDGNVDGDRAMSERFADMISGGWQAHPHPAPEPGPVPEPEAFFTIAGIPALKHGDTGATVKALQGELIACGYPCGGKRDWYKGEIPDGIFGNVTQESVRSFQRARGLPETGVADQKTRAALLGV